MNNLWEIWSLRSHKKVIKEIQRVALKIGELSFTLKLLGIFSIEAIKVIENLHKRKQNLIDLFFNDVEEKKKQKKLKDLKEKKKYGMVGRKHKKVGKCGSIEKIGKVLKYLDHRLQYLSVHLFSVGNHTHINVIF